MKYPQMSLDPPSPAWPMLPARAIHSDRSSSAYQFTTLPCLLVGWAAWNNDGANAQTVALYSGIDTSGLWVAQVSLAAAGSESLLGGPPGVLCPGGLYRSGGSGQVYLTVYVVLLSSG